MRDFLANTLFASVSLAATAAVVCFSSAPASAAIPMNDAPRAEVRFSDLDLATPRGQRTLAGRIHFAAELVCPVATPGIDVDAAQCRDNAIAQARREIAERLAVASVASTASAAL